MTRRTARFISWITLGTGLAFAQGSTATILGTVKDVSGAVLQGAMVTVRHLDTGLTRTDEADSSGNFSIPSLPVGPYEVTVQKEGFRREVRRGVELVVAQEAVVNLVLQVGSLEQQVTVTEQAPLVNTTLSSTSGLVSETQIKDMPLNGRSFDQLLTLNVGTSNSSTNTLNNGWTMFSVSGKRPETNRFTINGIDYIGGNAPGLFISPSGAGGQLLGVEAVREYNVISNTYGAEYGKRAGGQISVVTTSGTNQLHGDVYEYLRNSAFDARNFFDQTIGTPPFKRHQFGGALGGPLKKDKLFLFGNYEAFRQRLALSQLAIVPDNCVRQGQFPNASGACAPVANLQQGMLPFAKYFWPAPNGNEFLVGGKPSGAAQYFSNAPQSVREDFGLLRFDYTASTKDSLSVNFTIDNGQRDVSQPDPNFVQVSVLHPLTLGLQETHVFSSSLVNSLTVGFSRNYATLGTPPAAPIPQNLVFLPGGNPGSIIIGGGAVTVVASAYTPANGTNVSIGVRNHYTWADDLRFNKGRHSFSFGGWMQRVQQNAAGAAQASAGNVAYNTLMDFLQDKPSQFIINRNPLASGYRSLEAAWYVQDEIKLRPNLTMRVGLRDEMTNGWNEVAGRCANYVYDANFVIQADTIVGNSCFTSNQAKALWQPRVGIAWDPTGTGTWAVRAGFGIHNDLIDNLAIRVYPNPPTNAREQFISPLLSLYPLQRGVTPPPSCSATRGQPCSVYAPAGVDPNLMTPTIQEWSFTVERELTKDLMLQVGYVGSQSYHTNITFNANTARPQVCANPQGCVSGGTLTNGNPVPVSQRAIVPLGTTYMAPGQRPNPYVSSGVSWWNQGTSSYHSLNVSLLKRVSHGLTFKANYSYAKVMDLNSALLAPSGENEPPALFNPYQRFLNKGIAAYSLAHQFNANFSYQLPFGNGQRFGSNASGLMNHLIGGWQWNGIFTAQDGFPQTPLVGSNTSGTGDASNSDVPNWNPNFKGPVVLGKPDQWFDPHAFLIPAQGTFGNVARGSFRGPGLVNVDTSFFKKFKISERWLLQFRAEAFNILNHSNFSYPTEVVFNGADYSPSAGVITQTNGTSRQLQFALKLLF
jgi:carboxypeptidase family protein